MRRLEQEAKIEEALSVLKDLQRLGKKSRIHQEARVEITARQIALERGDCRECQMLIIEIKPVKGNKKGVALMCQLNESPLELHRPYVFKIGTVPSCPSVVPFKQEEESSSA